MDIAYILTENTATKGVDINAQKSVFCQTTGDAMKLYHKATERLLFISRWDELTDESDCYMLLDNRGLAKYGSVLKGDYIQVKRAHTRLTGEDEYQYWLVEKVLQIKTEDLESTAIRVRCSSNPALHTSQAFRAANTNTLIVERHGHTVRINFHPHHDNTVTQFNSTLNPIHQMVLFITNWLGVPRNRWEKLAEGLLFN